MWLTATLFPHSPDARAKLDVGEREARQRLAKFPEQSTLVELRQLLDQHRIANLDLHDPSLDSHQPRLFEERFTSGFGPGRFEPQPVVFTSPTAGDEQSAEDIADVFRTAIGFAHCTPIGTATLRGVDLPDTTSRIHIAASVRERHHEIDVVIPTAEESGLRPIAHLQRYRRLSLQGAKKLDDIFRIEGDFDLWPVVLRQ